MRRYVLIGVVGVVAGILLSAVSIILAGSLDSPSDPTAMQTGAVRRVFAFEYTTQNNQWLAFWNIAGWEHTVTVEIYNPDGSHWGDRTVTLRAYETKTISDPKVDWGLVMAPDHGTPSDDYAYGMVAHSNSEFGMFVSNDEQQLGGSGYNTIYPLDAYNDAWWGMYNYPSDINSEKDYFFLTNPENSQASATVVVYDSNGNQLSSTNLALDAYQTIKVYPQDDLGIAMDQQNIGLHMTSASGMGLSVFTMLGSDFKFGEANPWYDTHANTTGLYLPWTTNCLATQLAWTEALTGTQLSAARITNPNDYAVDVTQTIYVYDNNGATGDHYQNSDTVPTHGTIELDLPNSTDFRDEGDNAPWHHARVLDSSGPVQVHVSYESNIDLPAALLNSWLWGAQDPSRTRTVFIINPNDYDITVHSEAWDYQSGSLRTQTGNDLVIPSHDAKLVSYISSEGPVFESYNDVTYRFYSDAAFALHLQEPTYGDVLPAECGPPATAVTLRDFRVRPKDLPGLGDLEGLAGALALAIILASFAWRSLNRRDTRNPERSSK